MAPCELPRPAGGGKEVQDTGSAAELVFCEGPSCLARGMRRRRGCLSDSELALRLPNPTHGFGQSSRVLSDLPLEYTQVKVGPGPESGSTDRILRAARLGGVVLSAAPGRILRKGSLEPGALGGVLGPEVLVALAVAVPRSFCKGKRRGGLEAAR